MANQGCLGFLFNLFGITHSSAPDSLPFRTRDDALLTPAELSFYQVLRLAVGNAYTICAKVNLADIFQTKPYSRAYHNKIDRKHVDFLLCDPTSMRPVVGIELDDSSHERPDRIERDEFVDRLFKTCGLPLRHFPARRSYDPHQIRAMLQQGTAPGITYEAVAARQKADPGPITPTPIVGGRKPLK